MVAVLCLVFFVSGASALIFETLWFRLAGITFGNSVWAGSIVLTSFMAGLALGNALAARYGRRIARPLVLYARLEIVIAVVGVLLVLALPRLSEWLVPLFRPVLDRPWMINPLRLVVAFLLMLVPTTAMGMTLPLLVKVLFRGDPNFGKVLGRLYGWNTLGAVAGALAGEAALIGWLGLRGTGYVAGSFNLLAACGALAIASRLRPASPSARTEATSPDEGRPPRLSARSRRLLLGSFLAGGILLAFEVVWFRFLQLFVMGTSLAFAVMLAVVLAGIGLGGLAASWWLRFRPRAHESLIAVALAGGIVSVLVYLLFAGPESALSGRAVHAWALVRLAATLTFPTSLLSGVLFALFGHAAQREIGQETRTAGLLTLANTTGAALGALAGGFVLLPLLGLERSFFLLALCYAAVAACALEPLQWRRPTLHANGALAVVHLILLVVFPFGSMAEHLDAASRPYRERFRSRTVAVREGLTETIQYLRRDFAGEPLNHRLMTNGYSMSGNSLDSKRYMKYFVYWPLAVHPDTRRALLIGYGAGSTARALTDTRRLESIDVVDISRDVLELSPVVFPDPSTDPLRDPRVAIHVEDGRYFLQTADREFDLITAEPPPPVVGGAVNLYTEEYFHLIHSRLAAGGIVTYWLPVTQMTLPTTRSILAAFCNVFDDCSLWAGSKLDWVMIGSRGATGPGSTERFAEQWRDAAVAPELRALGLELPAQVGATFIADAAQLASLVDGEPPLIDDRPGRLSLAPASREERATYHRWADVAATRPRFERSDWIAMLWPEDLARQALRWFRYQPVANMQVFPNDPSVPAILGELLERRLGTAALWVMGSSAAHARLAERATVADERGELAHHRAAAALARGEFERAAALFGDEPRRWPDLARRLEIFALCRAGRVEQARRLAGALESSGRRALGYACW